ncbi:uncharacterized protein LOC142776105 [Rhipicephalus microplus]|uniref:uncharacterized protein LOC142776105 n=1 Tax=Rhipicephalus microplus TaxID=6941 RepID=UPI003F6D666C
MNVGLLSAGQAWTKKARTDHFGWWKSDGEKTALHFQAAFVPCVGDTGAPPMETVGGVGRGDLAQPHTNQRGGEEDAASATENKFRLRGPTRSLLGSSLWWEACASYATYSPAAVVNI